MVTIEICLNCESDFRQYFDTQLECKACRVDESPLEVE